LLAKRGTTMGKKLIIFVKKYEYIHIKKEVSLPHPIYGVILKPNFINVKTVNILADLKDVVALFIKM
jgi:hypothetical protein